MVDSGNERADSGRNEWLLFLFIGLFFSLHGLGRSGMILKNYEIWNPVSPLIVAVICIAGYFIVSHFLVRSGKLTAISGISSVHSRTKIFYALLLLIGVPVLTVITRDSSLAFDPVALFIGFTVFAMLFRHLGGGSVIISAILIVPAILPLAGVPVQDNPNNPNLLPAYLYQTLVGVMLMLWVIMNYLRMIRSVEQTKAA